MYVGIEGRGTEFLCAIGSDMRTVEARTSVPTTTPEETLARVLDFVRDASSRLGGPRAAGIACFGPLDLDRGVVTYTLKPGWQGFPIVDTIRDALDVPVVLDTDVNAAAVAEGAARGRRDLVFVTIGTGTGIGAGALVDGSPVHGLSHPEMGHLPVTRHPDDPMPGLCPYHGDCLEGLATSRAMTERSGLPVELADAAAIRLEAWYLAQLATTVTYVLSPETVVFDGAVIRLPGMLEAIQEATRTRLADDPAVAGIARGIETYLRSSVLDGEAALRGALALAASTT